MTVDLLSLSEVVGGGVYFAAADVGAVLHAYAEWAPRLPETSTTSVALLRLPSSDALPDPISGRHVAHVRFASLDSASAVSEQLGDLRAVARPLLDTVAFLPYGKLGSIHGDPTSPMPVANGTASLATLDARTVDAVLTAADLAADLPLSSVEIRTLGKATHLSPVGGDAIGGRANPHLLNVYAAPVPTLSDDKRLAAVRQVLGAVEPWRSPVNLVNFVGRGNDGAAIVDSWTSKQNEQLDRIRGRYDPERLFPFARHFASAGEAAP